MWSILAILYMFWKRSNNPEEYLLYSEEFTSAPRSPLERMQMSKIVKTYPDATWDELLQLMRKHNIAISPCVIRTYATGPVVALEIDKSPFKDNFHSYEICYIYKSNDGVIGTRSVRNIYTQTYKTDFQTYRNTFKRYRHLNPDHSKRSHSSQESIQ